MKRKDSKAFIGAPAVKPGEPVYRKMVYKLLSKPHMDLPKAFFSKKEKRYSTRPRKYWTFITEDPLKRVIISVLRIAIV
jgi:hypothetical protein